MFFLSIVNPVVTGFIGKKQSDAPAIFAKFFSALVGLLLLIASIWALVHLLLGGIEWITSGGDKGKLETAQHHITSAIIGIIIVFASWSIYLLILRFLGLTSGTGGGIRWILPTLL